MASEQRLYTFSTETKDKLRKFRLGTSRSEKPQAIIFQIDKKTLEVKQSTNQTYDNLLDISEDLPENTPRFILLSYPLTVDGRSTAPYVLLSYLPPTSSAEQRMLYAGARELMRAQSEAGKVIEVDDAETELGDGVEWLEEKLKA